MRKPPRCPRKASELASSINAVVPETIGGSAT
jgi:hypothetical protein